MDHEVVEARAQGGDCLLAADIKSQQEEMRADGHGQVPVFLLGGNLMDFHPSVDLDEKRYICKLWLLCQFAEHLVSSLLGLLSVIDIQQITMSQSHLVT